MIRTVQTNDIQQICDIYNYYIEDTIITFEETPLSLLEMEARVQEKTKHFPWFVFEENDRVVGYAYASEWKERSAYRFTVETSVYIDKNYLGKGAGSSLYQALLDDLRKRDVHAVIAILALPNERSQKLQEKFSFKKAAHFYEVGFKMNQWIDVGYWELLLK